MTADLLLPSLAGSSVALAAWSLCRAAMNATDGDRRKLKARLSSQLRPAADPSAEAQRSSIRNDHAHPAGGLGGRLRRWRFARHVESLLQTSLPDLSLERFAGLTAGLFAACFLLILAATMNPIVSLVAGGLGAFAPFVYLTKRKTIRQRHLDDQLPDAMDFLGRSLKAGHSLSTGMQMMGQELPQPMAGEFMHAFGQHSLGIPMEKVLRDMTRRIDSTDFAFFVTAVLIQRQTGGDLGGVLKNISGMIRQRVRLQQQVKAKTAEGRFTGYLLTAFPAVIFVVLYVINREYTSKLTDTTLGLQLLGGAFCMQVLGLTMIRKLTTVKV